MWAIEDIRGLEDGCKNWIHVDRFKHWRWGIEKWIEFDIVDEKSEEQFLNDLFGWAQVDIIIMLEGDKICEL